jgi:hypothetical protein
MLRDVADLYNRNIIQILLICLILVIPITFFNYSAIVYITGLDALEYANIPAFCIWILNFTMLFPPFFLIAKMDAADKETSVKNIILFFLSKFGAVAFITIALFIVGIAGSFLFLIPTVLAVIIILLFPLFTDHPHIGGSLKNVWKVVKNEHVFILLDVIIIVSLNVLVWSGSLYLLESFENNTFVFVTLRALVNALIFPILYFYLTYKYRKDLI